MALEKKKCRGIIIKNGCKVWNEEENITFVEGCDKSTMFDSIEEKILETQVELVEVHIF